MSKLSQMVGNLNDRPSKQVIFPSHEGTMVRLWVLTQHEDLLARKAAGEFVTKELGFTELDLSHDQERALDDALMAEVLVRALRDPEDALQQFADSADEIRKLLPATDIEGLWNEYLTFRAERSPFQQVKDYEQEFDDILDRVRQGFPMAMRLSRYASPSLRRLLLTALDRCASGTTPSSSDGSSGTTLAAE